MQLFDFLKNQSKLASDKIGETPVPQRNIIKLQLDTIQKEIFHFLMPLGFRKKGRTFNRETEDGIYQVVNIQSGKYEFGDKYVIPGLRENYYGKFTVNLGIMVYDIYKLGIHNKPKDIYQEYDCQIRTRLSHLTIKQDLWWPISGDNKNTSKDLIEALNSHGIQWLNTFEDRNMICENWGIIEGSSARAKLDVALIILNNNKEKGEILIRDYYYNIKNNNGHKEYVKGLAEKLGLKID